LHHLSEEAAAVIVVGLLFKLQILAVLDILAQLFRDTLAQRFYGSLAFLVLDAIVLLILRLAGQPLPRQDTLKEVNQDVTDRFEVISARLLDTDVRVA